MLAPCMTVLSTSKNAAAVGSLGVSNALSTSADADVLGRYANNMSQAARTLGRGHPASVAA